jgi:tetraacyldisaccharide 4'-kinase
MRSSLEIFFLREWQRASAWQLLLRPLSWLFAAVTALRRLLFRLGIMRTYSVAVPVIVVGNLSVGGTGKTPLVIALAERFTQAGRHVGVITRGYARRASRVLSKPVGTAPVAGHHTSIEASDEALMMSQRLAAPVFANPARIDAAALLLKRYPQTDVVLSDDGLQHYALKRDIEIAVIDAVRGFGNGALLPAGPLREPVSRLAEVDCIVLNETGIEGSNPITGAAFGGKMPAPERGSPSKDARQYSGLRNEIAAFGKPVFAMRFGNERFRRLAKAAASTPEDAASFTNANAGKRVAAVAGIGNPERFFSHLETLGLKLTSRHAFADHHAFVAGDLSAISADVIVMTEKDAVKCAVFNDERAWCMQIDALLPDAFYDLIETKLKRN